MKKIYVLAIMAGFVCSISATQVLHYDSITPRMQLGGYYVGQSNFTVNGLEGVVNGQFATFCLELEEDIYLGRDYSAVVNTETVGAGGTDALSASTAWLYNEFLSGSIGIGNAQDAVDIQMAIWMLEDEPITDYFDESYITAQAETLKNSALNSGWTDIGDIRVLNITENGTSRQDMLVQYNSRTIPEPSTVALFGLAGVVIFRKKK